MGIGDAVRTKRAIRTFADRPLSESDLEAIIEAGRRSGSSKNLQRWDFIVVRDRARLQGLTGIGKGAWHLAGAALAIALVTPDPKAPDAPLSIIFDLGQVAANMTLVAWGLGIGSVPATVYDHDLAGRLLELPPDRHCEYLISFGYPKDPAELTSPLRAAGRKSRDSIVHEETW